MQRSFTYRANGVTLDCFGVVREPTRDPAAREPGFDDAFDASTLFFDNAIRTAAGRAVLLGPPLNNLEEAISEMQVTAGLGRTSSPFSLKSMNRHAQIWVDLERTAADLTIDTRFGALNVPVIDARPDLYAGRRVLLTVSKDNDLIWIEDWVRYHRDVHGADAVLIYDNNSSIYTIDALKDALSRLDGIAIAGVVDWPFKYGPQGKADGTRWDSDFCQSGALEHARWMFLSDAASVLNADIDECVVAGNGKSVFEAAEQSWWGITAYRGLWMPGIEELAPETEDAGPLRHRAFDHYLTPEAWPFAWRWRGGPDICPPKWCAVPSRAPFTAQWQVHRIKGWPAAYLPSRIFSYRHFREINTGWKYRRSQRAAFNARRHVRDVALSGNYAKVRWQV